MDNKNLFKAILYLKDLLMQRLGAYRKNESATDINIGNFVFEESDDWFTKTVADHGSTAFEFVALLLAIAPHFQSDFLDNIVKEHFPEGNQFPAFGGVRGKNHRGILPTGETAQFVIAGNDLAKRC